MNRHKNRFARWVWRSITICLVFLVLYQVWLFAHICWWIKFNPATSAFMETRLEVMQDANPQAELKYRWVNYANISNHLKRALIAAEDANFLEHEGFDWEGIQNAYEKNLKRGKIVAGGSTISQQLAKNLFLSTKRTPWRKAEEAIITIMLESVMDKRRILEIYLNVIEWGDGVFGAEAAARYHYGGTAAGLSAEQAARLAAMAPSPRRYGPGANTAYLGKRTSIILARAYGVRVP